MWGQQQFADGLPAYGTYGPISSFSWTGFYIGGQAGGIWGNEDLRFNPPTKTVNFSGGVFGGQLGAQYEFHNHVVLGVEVSFTDSGDSSGSTLCPNPAFTCHAKLRDETQVVGRLGYGFGDFLPYVKGGYANVSSHFNNSPLTAFPQNADNHQHDGWVVGSGLEYAVTRNIVLGVDYSHIEFDRETYTSGGATFKVDGSADAVTARISFKFNPLDDRRYAPPPLK